MFTKCKIDDLELVEAVESASQSWKKSSGHAFESLIKQTVTNATSEYNIKFILQKDLNGMIKKGLISNDDADIKWLKTMIKSNVFDLYAIVQVGEETYCFACIQCKTSIRDRNTRDREPSQKAMDKCFWSIVLVLDGDYLKNGKFVAMVNGGTEEFPDNGWHAMYFLSDDEPADSIPGTVQRIYHTDLGYEVLVKHARIAAHSFTGQGRRLMKKDWKVEDYDLPEGV